MEVKPFRNLWQTYRPNDHQTTDDGCTGRVIGNFYFLHVEQLGIQTEWERKVFFLFIYLSIFNFFFLTKFIIIHSTNLKDSFQVEILCKKLNFSQTSRLISSLRSTSTTELSSQYVLPSHSSSLRLSQPSVAWSGIVKSNFLSFNYLFDKYLWLI